MQKILIIDNEVEIRGMYHDFLEVEGFEIIEAENGIKGVQLARQHLPSLIVCDILLPKLDGYSVLKTLRKSVETAMIPFVFLTGLLEREYWRQGMQLGAEDYITKPSTADELLEAILTQIHKRAQLEWAFQATSPVIADSFAAKNTSIFPKVSQFGKVFNFIEANYYRTITLGEVAQAVGYSAAYLTNQVGKKTGKTVNQWIVERRMLAARSLLERTEQSIEKIAEAIGYQNTCHFSRQFRKYYNTTPQSWRKRHLQKTNYAPC